MNQYSKFTPEQMNEHLSFYLLDSWSYSKVSCFARNEKAFEKEYIYCERGHRSASSIAGNAYHKALEFFFSQIMGGYDQPSLIDLQQVAYIYIDEVPSYEWKLQKTTPTIEKAREKANKDVTAALQNFFNEMSVYMEDLQEVLGVEERIEEWLTVNGVDVPLPCHSEIDLAAAINEGKTVIIDHKLKSAYSDEKEAALVHGKQAICYVLQYEARHPGIKVDEVWFMENKISANKDKSPQIKKFVLAMDADSRRLYEALLYEPLRRMIEAVSNPDYVYTINDSDILSDKAELYEFWSRTLIAEVDDFNIPEGKKSLIAQRQRKIKDSSLASIDPRVITSFRKNAASFITFDYSMTDMNNSERIEHCLRTFGQIVKVAHDIHGYSTDTYLLECGAGVKITNISRYNLEIASALCVPNVRIGKTLVQFEGRAYLPVEVNKKQEQALLWDAACLAQRRIPIGLDNYGRVVFWDLDNQATPHMLVCGATGSGKSVHVRSVIEYARLAGITRIIIFDPKNEFPHLACETIEVVSEIKDIEVRAEELVKEMQDTVKKGGNRMAHTLLVCEEFSDAVDQSAKGKALDIKERQLIGNYANGSLKFQMVTVGRKKSLEENIKMLAQKGRSVGYRIMLATQRASTKVIDGDIKVNFPVQICFRVPKAIDSMVVIDEEGAENLEGHGDGLMKSPEYLNTVRFQGFYYKR